MHSDLTVIICTKNREADLQLTLHSLISQKQLPDNIIIVDDGDTPQKIVLRSSVPILYIRPDPPSSGIPAARNTGLRYVTKETGIVLFIDDDVTLDPWYIHTIQEFFEAHPKVSGTTGLITSLFTNQSFSRRLKLALIGLVNPYLLPISFFTMRVTLTAKNLYPAFPNLSKEYIPAQWLSGCNMAYRTEIFEKGYRFPEAMTGYADGEDLMFSYPLHRRGMRLAMVTGAKLIHRESYHAPQEKIDYQKYKIRTFYGGSWSLGVRLAICDIQRKIADFIKTPLIVSSVPSEPFEI